MPKDLHLPVVSPASGFGVAPLSMPYSSVLFSLSYLLAKPTRGSPSLPCAFTQAVECGWEQGKQRSRTVRSQFKSMGATDVGPPVLSSIWHWSVHRGNIFTGVFCYGVNKQRPPTPASGHRAILPGLPALIDWDAFETMGPTSLSSLMLLFSGYFAEIRSAQGYFKGIFSQSKQRTHGCFVAGVFSARNGRATQMAVNHQIN